MKAVAVGTFAWDTIRDAAGGVLFEGPGGLIHCVAALSALLPREAAVVPVSQVAHDSLPELFGILAELPGVCTEGIAAVPGGRYRVELRYHDDEHRCEQAHRLPPPLDREQILRHADGADGLLFNFISGEDAAPESLRGLRSVLRGPLVVDLHSLTLGRDARGRRTRKRDLDGWRDWLPGADVVQVNEEELAVLGGRGGERIEGEREVADLAAEVLERGVGALIVTRGAEGARLFDEPGSATSIEPVRGLDARDPTGCGDVHGAALLVGLMRGLPLARAARLAGRAAAEQCRIAGWPRSLPGYDALIAQTCG